jgi:hypothetical protein
MLTSWQANFGPAHSLSDCGTRKDDEFRAIGRAEEQRRPLLGCCEVETNRRGGGAVECSRGEIDGRRSEAGTLDTVGAGEGERTAGRRGRTQYGDERQRATLDLSVTVKLNCPNSRVVPTLGEEDAVICATHRNPIGT